MGQKILVAVDVVVLFKDRDSTFVLLIQRKNEPFKNQWALPGGFVENDEKLESAAERELEEETGLKLTSLDQVYAFVEPKRDPRSRVISIAFKGTVDEEHKVKGDSDAKNAKWFGLNEFPELAFDHYSIIQKALKG